MVDNRHKYVCDECGAVSQESWRGYSFGPGPLPQGWLELGASNIENVVFCGLPCLIKWAQNYLDDEREELERFSDEVE